MIIKKFVAKTEAEATALAKSNLGDDIVIMNVKKVKPKGFFAFLRSAQTEVTVAKEEQQPETASDENVKAALSAINDVVVSSMNKQTLEKPEPEKEPAPEPARQEESAIEEKLDSLQSLLTQLHKPEEEPQEEKEVTETDMFLDLLKTTLLDNEVQEEYADGIIEEIRRISKPGAPFDLALSNAYQKIILKFGKPIGIMPAAKGPKVSFFIGPTGVGKTTTIAKLASHFLLEEKKKVGLLTSDTFRIAAAEQLHTYANILEAPFKVIYSAEELTESVNAMQDMDYILVDTSGHSHHNEEQQESTKKLIQALDGVAETEVYLVVSATTKYRDLLSIADSYKEVADYKLIFTKLDETTTLGNLLNLKLYTGATLSYVTNGQDVPDDIEDFNAQKTVKRLLGGKE